MSFIMHDNFRKFVSRMVELNRLDHRQRASRVRPRLCLEWLEERTVPATVQTFDGGGSPYVLHGYGGTPPDDTVVGPTGNLVRLAAGTSGSIGSLTFGVTETGAFGEVQMDFDFRMIPTIGRADGFGVALLNTAITEYGTAPFVGGLSEEPTFLQSFGVGFDSYQSPGEVSANHISIHFNQQKLTEVDVTPFAIDLASGAMIHATITVRFGVTPSSGDVTVVLTPSGGNPTTVINQFVVQNLLPYNPRVHVMARSGGEAAHHDLDNFNVQYTDPVALNGTFQLTAPKYTVVESQPMAVVKVIRTGGTQGQVTVTIATTNGSSTAGQDFTGIAPTVLTFEAGDTTKVINIPILNDAIAEADETFTVTLSNATDGAALGVPASATVTIFDVDDDPTSQVGSWSAAIPLEVVGIHQVMLPTGEILFWSRHGTGEDGDPRLFNPTTGEVRMAGMLDDDMDGEMDYDLFCAGHTLMADGRVFFAGGHIADGVGENKAVIYDPWKNTWTRVPDMNNGRWYPTATLLPNGDILVIGGTINFTTVNALPQVYEVKTNTWRDLSTALLGNFPEYPDFYPWATVADDGRVFIAGPQQTGRYLDTTGTGTWTDVADSLLRYRDYGSAVEYSEGKILITGGKERVEDNADPGVLLPSDTAEVIDINAGAPAYQPVAPMTTGRRHHNLTVLPDDTVLATGGSSAPGFQDYLGAVLYPELWEPTSNTWTPQAANAFPLLYHSNAMLLPTGQVFVTGGGQPAPFGGQDEPRGQIFSPAYLFKGARPTIASAPASANYGQSFAVETSSPANIEKVTLIALPSPTHAFNENQGISHLAFTQTATGVLVTAPANSASAPPGFYYLFVIDSAGVPSIAQIIQLGTAVTIEQGSAQADPTNVGSVVFDVVFDAPVTGFTGASVDLSDSTVGGTLSAVVAGSGTTYTVTVTGMSGIGTVVARVLAGAAVDGFDIGTIASTSTDNSVTFDSVGPAVTINQAATQMDPTETGPILFAVQFDEPVTGLIGTDIDFTGSADAAALVAAVTGSGTDYVVSVTGMSRTGLVVVSIPAGSAMDGAGNGNTASTNTDNSVAYNAAGRVSFDAASYTAIEGDVAFNITVTRTGDGVGEVEVDFGSANITAVEGLDYVNSPLTLTWADGETGPKTLSVPIKEDDLNEGRESFALVLTNLTGGVIPGIVSSIVTILPSDPLGPGPYLDQDGDKFTIKLGGKLGTLEFYRTDPDGDGKGPIELIVLADTLPDPLKPKATLTISVVKAKNNTGPDAGVVGLGAVTGTGLKSITARKANLNMEGIDLTGYLGSLVIGNVLGGADVITDKTTNPKLKTRINALAIGDGTTVDVAAHVSSLTATSFGVGLIEAPSIGTLNIKGNMAADVMISGVGVDPTKKALTALRVKDIVTASDMFVTGNVGTVTVGAFRNSRLFAGYSGANDGSGTFGVDATLNSFRSIGKTDGFQNSWVIATSFKTVHIANLDATNAGIKFGFYADKSLGAITVLEPPFKYDPSQPTPQGIGDFEVNIV